MVKKMTKAEMAKLRKEEKEELLAKGGDESMLPEYPEFEEAQEEPERRQVPQETRGLEAHQVSLKLQMLKDRARRAKIQEIPVQMPMAPRIQEKPQNKAYGFDLTGFRNLLKSLSDKDMAVAHSTFNMELGSRLRAWSGQAQTRSVMVKSESNNLNVYMLISQVMILIVLIFMVYQMWIRGV